MFVGRPGHASLHVGPLLIIDTQSNHFPQNIQEAPLNWVFWLPKRGPLIRRRRSDGYQRAISDSQFWKVLILVTFYFCNIIILYMI